MREPESLRHIVTSVAQGLYCLGELRDVTVVLQPATRPTIRQVAITTNLEGLMGFITTSPEMLLVFTEDMVGLIIPANALFYPAIMSFWNT